MPTISEPNLPRSTTSLTECVEHRGCCLPNGYGKLGRGGKTWLAHRYAWHAAFGPIPEGMHVCHKCDNRRCIRPDHLFLGTRQDNMQDMIAKGRAKFVGFSSPNYRAPSPRKGEKNGRATITPAIADEMRAQAGRRQVDIAKQFCVSQATVWRVLTGKSWC